jgi:hypothetical protein
MDFRFKDLALHAIAFADRQPGACGPCTATAPPEKAPKPKPRPECPQASQKAPQRPEKTRPAKRNALDLLRQQLRAELRTSG